MNVTLGQVAQWVDGRLCDASGDTVVHQVAIDSRRVISAQSIFFALQGPNFDGHDFVRAALKAGAVAAVVRRGEGEGPRIEVDDTLAALQDLGASWRRLFQGKVIGVTGSHGKTIVKEMAAAILSRKHRVHRSPGSYNSQIGVALALLGLRAEHELAIIEAGISEVGEMERLRAMIRPDVGVLTSIGQAHFAGLGGDLESTAREKLNLFEEWTRPVILPAGAVGFDPADFGDRAVMFHVKHSDRTERMYERGYRAEKVVRRGEGFHFQVTTPGSSGAVEVVIQTPGRYNVENATAATALAMELGASADDVVEGLASFEAAPMRMEMHTTQSGVTILNDAYVSDPTSARSALETLAFYAGNHRRIAILGDMRELGELAQGAHGRLGKFAAKLPVDHLVAVGRYAGDVVHGATAAGLDPGRTHPRSSLEGLANDLEEILEPGDFVLFKGSRAIGLESVAESLVESVAPERLEIDLDAICRNVGALRREMGPTVGMMAVVKSFAYGNDSTRVSQTLVREGVEWLVVAYPDEAIPLRRKGIGVPILVTNVLAAEADKFAKYRLTALVSSEEVVRALGAAARAREVSIGLHLEVDTGMKRTGVAPSLAVELADQIASEVGVELRGVMTHLAAADDADEDEFTLQQLRDFDETREALERAGHRIDVVHAANTAGAWRFPAARYNFVRVGLGLYGVSPGADVSREAEFVPALRFTSRILQVRRIEKGESVGYGRAWVAKRASRIATVAIGYNDGFPRFMSNGGAVLIAGQRCPVVGNVCMDATMVDVTDVGSVKAGDEVVLFGSQSGAGGEARIEVDEIASRGGTISYEILTGISPRVRRIFRRADS